MDKKSVAEMSGEELEAYLDSTTDRELDAIAQGKFAPLVTPKPRFKPIQFKPVQLPENISKSDAAFYAVMLAASGVVGYCMVMLLSSVWLPFTIDKAAHDYAGKKLVPTRVNYCADTNFGGRYCTIGNNQEQFEKFVIREDS